MISKENKLINGGRVDLKIEEIYLDTDVQYALSFNEGENKIEIMLPKNTIEHIAREMLDFIGVKESK